MKKLLLWGLSLWMTLSAALPSAIVQAQDRDTRNNNDNKPETRVNGRILKTYQEDNATASPQAEGAAATQAVKQRPLWVENALQRSLDFLSKPAAPTSEQADGGTRSVARNARQEFGLVSAQQDDLGFTHVRLNQFRNGIRVFGGQVVTHLNANNVASVSGQDFDTAEVETTPAISSENALAAAKNALKYQGKFESEPNANLVILPNSLFKSDDDKGTTLVYHVELQIEDGTDATAHHQYFINAKDGSVVWHFNSLDHGTGYGLYTGGGVFIKTRQTFSFPLFKYSMIDDDRGDATTLNNGVLFEKNLIDVWGNGTNSNAESAGVDAHYGMMKTWDYFRFVHGRLGIDGAGYKMVANVHYGTNYNNAFWNGTRITFGDGNGTTFSPLVSMDVVAHEITHGLTQKTAGLIYSKESGALNESFSDIFGTMVEYYAGLHPDFLIGEDCYTPGTSGDALRSMVNPTLYGDPDHYTNRYTGTGDNGGVHTNSGIPNNAFYLLSQGGTNGTSHLSVAGIGRAKAAAIFFRALTVYMTASDRFIDARRWTLQAARDLYGLGSAEYNSVAQAWRDWVPQLVRTGVGNVFGNIGDVWSTANHFLQGKVGSGFEMGMRVITNTFFGIGGLLDPATEMRLPRRSEDFGQTLGVWGFGPGPYVVLPFMGPSSLRDAVGLPLDRYYSAPTWVFDVDAYLASALQLINLRADLLATTQLLNEVSLDRYSFVRDAYLSRRLDQVYDGNPPLEKFDDDAADPPPTPKKGT